MPCHSPEAKFEHELLSDGRRNDGALRLVLRPLARQRALLMAKGIVVSFRARDCCLIANSSWRIFFGLRERLR